MDGRRERGDRTRRAVAAQAAKLASVDGLAGITVGQLAEALGVAKSSVQAAYPTKERLQIAAVAAATDVFVATVVAPAARRPEGLPRLLALVDGWLGYVDRRVLPGGCFMTATLAEFDSHPGPIRDALARSRRGWLALLEAQTAIAQAVGDVPPEPQPAAIAFQIDAMLMAANVSRNLSDDPAPLDLARALIDRSLGQPPRRRPRRLRAAD